MKTITISFPTNMREIKEVIIDSFKKGITLLKEYIAFKRWSNNRKVFLKMEKDICEIINGGYWSADISDRMKISLTNSRDGYIPRIIHDAYKKMK